MVHHYLTTALRQVRRHKLTTSINIVCLSVGLVCFVIAYASVIYLQASERAFPAEQVVSLLLWDFSKPVAAANLIAWPLGFLAMQMYLRLFVQRMTLTVWPFVLSLVVTVLIAWFAVGIHTFRAARRKPAAVLRYE
jgi:hypothetical protein